VKAGPVRNRVNHRLTHPPRRKTDERRRARCIEPVRRFDETEISRMNQIHDHHTAMLETMSIANDETQICFDQVGNCGGSLC
jgi:hypothetical protein